MKDLRAPKKRSPETTEAWILGSGTASFAAALYLVQDVKIPAAKVHVLDSHVSIENVVHQKGNSATGYDQFAGCLPVPVGAPLKKLLASVPSIQNQGKTVLDDIQNAEINRTSVAQDHRTRFMKRNSSLRNIPTKSLNLSSKQRLQLIWFILKQEKLLGRNQIQDCLPHSFFQSSFWVVWSAQFGFQPWHSAAEFRRSLRLYLGEFHSLSILSCMDITGYYQHEYILLPLYRFLHSLGVDFQFDTKVADIATVPHKDHQTISQLDLIQRGFATRKQLGQNDIVIMTIGSTVSGSATGTNDRQPVWQQMETGEELDENWSLWLELGTRHRKFGNPYNFCTRQSESMMESFTITTEDLAFFQQISALSHSMVGAGAFISVPECHWKLNICIPAQPVFSKQPYNVRVLWGFALFPWSKGNYVKKPMLECSGAEIMIELLRHLDIPPELLLRRTVTIPRVMPRMSSILLIRSSRDRPEIIPQNTCNIGLIGQFVEIPRYSCADMSYGVRTAQIAVSQLMGVNVQQEERWKLPLPLPTLLRLSFWK
ncbi:hypothetical protein PENARI_c002G07840 [Penicillium arizonense]|uniref:Oleate hydratase n=1 Tax=Penicillium arizonense TaxID=1835702 RepID=A0A1F5LVH2_PENAI|nr:hypothetical protein PENARI_c002G07840 [Penicillium arizonense]OGE56949.1 hypothetical protein PENARI_c002G07840 [Penicillium arizonense]